MIHTAEVHRGTFDALRDRIAPEAEMHHEVRTDWLARAQDGIDDALKAEIARAIDAVSGPVVCTCTTLGPVAAEAGAMRVDWPMMQAAARTGGPIVMAYCLNSTFAPSLALLDAALEEEGCKTQVHPLPMAALWPLFEAGMAEPFAIGIAGEIRQALAALPKVGCVVLAQASMAGAAAHLGDLDVPVLSSPELALRAALAQAI